MISLIPLWNPAVEGSSPRTQPSYALSCSLKVVISNHRELSFAFAFAQRAWNSEPNVCRFSDSRLRFPAYCLMTAYDKSAFRRLRCVALFVLWTTSVEPPFFDRISSSKISRHGRVMENEI